VFSSLFFITLPNIEKYFFGIHFSKENNISANKQNLSMVLRKKPVNIEKENKYYLIIEKTHACTRGNFRRYY
jgi:hypothetical protein